MSYNCAAEYDAKRKCDCKCGVLVVKHHNIIHAVNRNNSQSIPIRITQRGKLRPTRKEPIRGLY